MKTGEPLLVPLNRLAVDDRLVVRERLDPARVALLGELYEADGPGALPPIVVFDPGGGELLVVDGHHRRQALHEIGIEDALVAPLITTADEALGEVVEVAIEAAVVSARNLTRREQRRVIVWYLEHRPQLSDREIGRRVGVAHTTVGRLRAGASHHGGNGRDPSVRAARGLVDAFRRLLALDEDGMYDPIRFGALIADEFWRFNDPAAWAGALVDVATAAVEELAS